MMITRQDHQSSLVQRDSGKSVIQNPEMAAIFEQYDKKMNDMVRFICNLNEAGQQFANETTREIRELKQTNRDLSHEVRVLKDELQVSREDQRTQQIEAAQRAEEVKKVGALLQTQTTQVTALKADAAVFRRNEVYREQVVSHLGMEVQNQNRIIVAQGLLAEQLRKKDDLLAQLTTTRGKMEMGIKKIQGGSAVSGGAIGFFTLGPIGGLLGFVAGLATGSAATSLNCPCLTTLRGEEQSFLTQLGTVDGEIQRLETEISNLRSPGRTIRAY